MAKFLVSDLIGTLVPDDTNVKINFSNIEETKKKIQIELDKQYEELGKQIRLFLEDGNYLIIVTSAEGHDGADFIIKNYIRRIYKIAEPYKKQVSIFMQARNLNMRDVDEETIIEDESTLRLKDTLDVIRIIESKKDVFHCLQKIDFKKHQLYSLGDTENDLEMLLSCKKLGGIPALINQNLSNIEQKDFNEIFREFIFEKSKYIQRIISADLSADIFEDLDAMFMIQDEIRDKVKRNTIEGLEKGLLSRYDLIRQQRIYNLIEKYNNIQEYSLNSNKRFVADDIIDLRLYDSFNDFRQNVLQIGIDEHDVR